MSEQVFTSVLYILLLIIVVAFYLRRRNRRSMAHSETWREAVDSGLTEPSTLHPVFDTNVCFGGGACVKACP
jgi:thioredoxin reductase (NADPH)